MSLELLHRNAVKFVIEYLESFEDFCMDRTSKLYARADRTIRALASQSGQTFDKTWDAVEKDSRARIRVHKLQNN